MYAYTYIEQDRGVDLYSQNCIKVIMLYIAFV